jgi:protein-S-isoprenylcysteine O-methyltransferase Ste14
MTGSPQDVEDRASVRVLPPLIPLTAILAGYLLQWSWPLSPGAEPALTLRLGVGGAVAGAGVLLVLWPATLFGRSGQNPNPRYPTPSMVTGGPYRFTRNPMYLGMVLFCVGLAVGGWNPWTLLLTPVCAFLLQRLAIEPEERYLEQKFGDEYRDYRKRVRRWL